jgi:hypothetical protein
MRRNLPGAVSPPPKLEVVMHPSEPNLVVKGFQFNITRDTRFDQAIVGATEVSSSLSQLVSTGDDGNSSLVGKKNRNVCQISLFFRVVNFEGSTIEDSSQGFSSERYHYYCFQSKASPVANTNHLPTMSFLRVKA